jgi:hypothetical protein
MAKKKKKKKSGPSEPKPINIGEVMRQGQQASQANLDQLRGFYGQLAGDIGGSAYAQEARAAAERGVARSDALAALADPTRQAAAQAADRVTGIGDRLLGQAGQINTQETGLESELRRQAMDDLALGRSLSPEQMREAAQSTRQAFAARGLGTGMGSAAAEILNRDRFATQRQDQRRAFAMGANQNIEGTLGARRALSADMLGSSANIYGAGGQLRLAGDTAAGNMLQSSGNMALNASNALATQNPYNIALGGLGSGTGVIQGASGMASDIAGFNTNMQASMYNSYMNNQAARQAANTTAGATRQAGMFSMIGNILSDRREKTDVKPLGQASGVLGLKVYEYRYKGDDQKRKGFMAQDVARVLPEAVAEVEYQGKKRLAIKPQIIGQALARELTRAAA